MSNSVVVAICRALVQKQIAALRFNFRGVGRSSGNYGGGIDEQEDVRAALALVPSTSEIDPKKIGLAGYSFGASVALSVAAENKEVSLLVLVSPALSDSGWEQLEAYSRPIFLISGEYDSVISPEMLQPYISNTPEFKQYEVIPGADHFWLGHEAEVADKVAEFFVAGFNNS